MHVLLIPSWYPADDKDVIGSFFREQAKLLRAAGVEVGVIAPRSLSLREPSRWRRGTGVNVVDDGGVPTYRDTFVDWFGPVPGVGPCRWIRRGLKLYRRYTREHGVPDVLHAHSLLNGGLLAERIASEHDVPFVVTEHSTAYARNLVPAWRMALAGKAANAACERIAVSVPFAELLGRQLPGTAPWRCIPNPVDSIFFADRLPAASSTGRVFQFCNVGLMTPKKGQASLIQAFSKAFKGSSDVTLAIAGDGVLRGHLESLARQLGVGAQVRFVGRLGRRQVVDLLRESNAFVLSSEFETFGVVVAEALAAGLPVVATRSGGPESIVRPEDGILVRVGDVAALSGAMLDIHRRRHEFRAESLRQGCALRYSPDAISVRLIEMYQDACRKVRQ